MKFYCMYCGHSSSSITSLTMGSCRNSPNGKHIPYEGDEKSKYVCKDCGHSSSSITSLTMGSCRNSPTGKHVPM